MMYHPFMLRRLPKPGKRRAAEARDLLGCRRGVAAIEFAVAGGVIALALVAMADAGLMARAALDLAHAVRVGAQAAMDGATPGSLEARMAAAGGEPGATFAAARICACPEATGAALACGATCLDSAPTAIFVELAGRVTYQGLIVPDRELSAALRVRLR